jgi:hypothetical protein
LKELPFWFGAKALVGPEPDTPYHPIGSNHYVIAYDRKREGSNLLAAFVLRRASRLGCEAAILRGRFRA